MTHPELVTFQIKSEGKAIEESLQVAELEVYHNVTGVSQARIIFLAGEDVPQLVDSPELEIGKRIEISLGYDQAEESVFAGILANQNLYVEPEQGAAFEIICEALSDLKPSSLTEVRKAKPMEVLTYGENILACTIQPNANGDAQAEGAFKVFGNNLLRPGGVVTIEGLGKAFSGNQHVSSVSHHVAKGQWVTDITISAVEEE